MTPWFAFLCCCCCVCRRAGRDAEQSVVGAFAHADEEVLAKGNTNKASALSGAAAAAGKKAAAPKKEAAPKEKKEAAPKEKKEAGVCH